MPHTDEIAQHISGSLGQDQDFAWSLLRDEARRHYLDRADFRRRRRLARNLKAGLHWEESVPDPDKPGTFIRERDLLARQNRLPLIVNFASTTMHNVEGQFRSNRSERLAFATKGSDEEAVRMMNVAYRAFRRMNRSNVIESDQFNEHAMSGASCQKTVIEHDPRIGGLALKDYEVDQTKLFYNLDISDRRFEGLTMIGEIHDDMRIEDVVAAFARTHDEAERVASAYGAIYDRQTGRVRSASLAQSSTSATGFNAHDRTAFDKNRPGRPEVLEIWYREHVWQRTLKDPVLEAAGVESSEVSEIRDEDLARLQNERREAGLPPLETSEKRYAPIWRVVFLTPDARVLKSRRTPFWHGGHPYSPGLATLVDGRVWGLLEHVVGIQRWLNRLVTSIDFKLNTGSKGMTIIDKSFLDGTGKSQTDFDDAYVRSNASFMVDPPQGKTLDDFFLQIKQQEVSGTMASLIPVVREWIEAVPGVTGAVKGEEPQAGTSGVLFQQQIEQATIGLLGYLETYFEALRDKDVKSIKTLIQALSSHSEPVVFPDELTPTPPGEPSALVEFDADRVRQLEFDVAMGNVRDTVTMRLIGQEKRLAYLEAGHIDFDTFLSISADPKDQELLQLRRQQASEQEPAGDTGEPPPAPGGSGGSFEEIIQQLVQT